MATTAEHVVTVGPAVTGGNESILAASRAWDGPTAIFVARCTCGWEHVSHGYGARWWKASRRGAEEAALDHQRQYDPPRGP